MKHIADVAIVGSGFAGSILAWILSKSGLRTALIDSTEHPRFAIGESSTPLADAILRRLSIQHAIPELEQLSSWGNWQRSFPQLGCGRKRGFSYFQHLPGQTFQESTPGQCSLLIAASESDHASDTHWYRSDVDHFLFQSAIASGAANFSGHRVVAVESLSHNGHELHLEGHNATQCITCDWIIDASGTAAITAKLAGLQDQSDSLRTRTQTTYAHYHNVGSWTEQLHRLGISTDRDPFNADDAAQHHLLQEGWLWMLRFNNGITSVGLTTPFGQASQNPMNLEAYPSVEAMMKGATVVSPRNGPRQTRRLQRLLDPVVGSTHLLAPTAALTLDPLHSTGIAHALAGVDRIATILLTESSSQREAAIEEYRRSFFAETRLLDLLVSTGYATMQKFDRFAAACSLFIAGAIRCEERYLVGNCPTHLWNADDREYLKLVEESCQHLLSSDRNFESTIRKGLVPWNSAGLMDPTAANRYAYTATKR